MSFAEWFIPKMEKIGFAKTYGMGDDKSVWLSFLDKENREGFHVCYVHKPIEPDEIRELFKSHNEPILFVVDASLFDDESVTKDPPLWMRVLHAIYYGRIYTWSEWNIFVAYHFDWQTQTVQYSEPLELDGILFTDTDCKLRDFPGLFHIARFYDRAFWKEQATPPPPKRERKGPRSNPNEEFWRQYHKQQTTEDVFRDFREAFERNKRQYQSQHYDTPYVKQNVTGGDKWLQGFISTGNLATARAMYKALAKEWHPDLNPGKPQAHETMTAINIAFDHAKEILV